MSDVERISEIEHLIATGKMSAAQVFTQMKQLLPAARAQQSGEGRGSAIPFVLGNAYQTVSGEWVRFVRVHNEGTSYETMEDESGVNRYTNRAGDMGRVTARPVDYPGNVPPMYTHPPKAQGVPEGWRSQIERALNLAKVFDDGSDGADGESAASVVAILSDLLSTVPPADKPEGERNHD